jgi:hypothetical protein
VERWRLDGMGCRALIAWFAGAFIGLLTGLAVGIGLIVNPARSLAGKRATALVVAPLVCGALWFLMSPAGPFPRAWAVAGVAVSAPIAAWRVPSIANRAYVPTH